MILDQLKKLHEIADRLEGWHTEFVNAMWAQTGEGTDDAFLASGQVATLRNLYDEYLGEKE